MANSVFFTIILSILSLFLIAVSTMPEAAAAGRPSAAEKIPGEDGLQWRLAVQAWTFHYYTFFEAVEKAQSLGLRYIEAYPGQKLSPEKKDIPFDHNAAAEVLNLVKAKLKKAGIRIVNYGVVGLGKDEAANRKIFEFAKKMGIETIVSEPAPGSFKGIDRLCEEFGINVAVHNHPKPSRYWNPDSVLEAIKGCGNRIGVCADTGHWMRSGVDPLQALKKLEGRIISFHFKDLNAAKRDGHDVPWGTGKGNARELFAEMHRQKFEGVFSIEYEHNWKKSLPELAECIKFFEAVKKDLSKK